MPIIKYIDLFVGALINIWLCAYVIKVVFKIEYQKNKLAVIISLIGSALYIAAINMFNKDVFKILLTLPVTIIAIKNVFLLDYSKSTTYVIVSTLYMFVGEIIAGVVLSLLPFDYTYILNNFLGTTIGAMIVVILTLLVVSIKKLNNRVNKLVSNKLKNLNVLYGVFIIFAIGALIYKIYNSTSNIIIIMNAIISVIFIIILYMYYSENIKLHKLSSNYNELFNYLEKYEKELIEKRKIIHDYKNQLIVINGYIGNNNKLKEYVNELIKEQRNISENSIIRNIDKLPRGLKGLIYYKFSHIDSNIKVNLQIIGSIKGFDKLSPKLNKETLKIIGILIDNAIEATNQEKEKDINIEFSLKNKIFKMVMSNHCTSDIKISNIMNVGYSTKGKNRGYGLSLIRDIIKSEKNISLDMNIENNEFISKLKVKI